MPRKRLSRDEAREQTRLRLLDAAALSIARKGLAATSVEDIAAQAGYTRGAFYSNFNSKSDLFVELLRLDHRNIQENLRKLLDAAPSSEELQKQLTLLYAQRYRDENNYVIWAEARLHAMRDDRFRQRMTALCLEKRDMIASFIEQFRKCVNVQLPGPCADYALAAIALMDGILYFNMTMPNELPNASAEAVLSNIFSRMFSSRPQ
ncbi:TetR family transcriptional regulator [Paraburkholderia sp. BL10I2N1]|uniref:TetR/AcrR family transcriptional regulator n=1 Tax=Paraburkholderia sp. BL10I2N1 TaxID=1938796 RepID=UPI001060A37E|nr:TetR family transcriptional regulator [Paraburkholderia sp. BL10I2N1]TDN69229.1 TetR family transcriptional regulator [Paraburkholderia sp. BL10I2N1]